MLRLIQPSPSIIATSAPCPQCGEPMDLKLVEPHPMDPRKKLRRIFAIQHERKKKLPPPTSGADHGFIALQVRQGPVAN